MSLINTNAYVFRGARGLIFGLSLHLHSYFMYASSKGAGMLVYICAGTPEPSLLDNAISTIIWCSGPYLKFILT